MEPCPDGATHATTGASASTACSDLDAGYYYTGVPGAPPAQLTNQNVLQCPKGFFCTGAVDITNVNDETGIEECTTGTTTVGIGSVAAIGCTVLLPGWHHNGRAAAVVTAATIVRCPANGFCPGGQVTYAATPRGIDPCPGYTCAQAAADGVGAGCIGAGAGTTTTPQTAISGCDNLDPGFYFTGAGPISATTVKACDAGDWCTGAARITLQVETGVSGTCPPGSDSPVGSDADEDCFLLAGYYFTGIGGVLNANTIQPCKPGHYCNAPTGGAFAINGGETGATACPGTTTCTGVTCIDSGSCVPPP